jgi:hypothetical protein
MRASYFLAVSLFATLVSFQSMAAEPAQDNQVKLTLVKYDDHIQVECIPSNKDTSTRQDWKAICNDMAAAQVQKLAAAGTIAPDARPVFDLSATNATAGQMLSKSIALSHRHL